MGDEAWLCCRGEHMDESDWWRYSQTKIFNIMTSRSAVAGNFMSAGMLVPCFHHKWLFLAIQGAGRPAGGHRGAELCGTPRPGELDMAEVVC